MTNVAIVGGGIAGLTAAFELTDPRNCTARARGCRCREGARLAECSLPSKVVVYERRSELGGKGASVRNEALDHRIEEHGLHIWFGYYENAFCLLDRCHHALNEFERQGQERWCSAITDVADGFHPASTVGLAEDDEVTGEWTRWWTSFPEDDALPWNRTRLDQPAEFDLKWFLPQVGRRTTALLHAALRSFRTDNEHDAIARSLQLVDVGLHALDPALDKLFSVALRWSSLLRRESARAPGSALITLALASLGASSQLIEYVRQSRDPQIAKNPAVRRLITVLDLIVGSTRGLLTAGIATDADIDRLDEWEWSEWLATHGVMGVSRDSTLVRALSYCLPFAYRDGSRDLPCFSAAAGVRLFLRTFFTYRGALMWKMNYGMGEVVFAPLYELLVKRGVEFHFEHELVRIESAAGRITQLHFERAADETLHNDDAHEDAREPYWPMRRLELEQGTLCYWPRRRQPQLTTPVSLAAGDDWAVVLALPLSVIAQDAAFIEAGARWYEAVHGRERHDGTVSPGLESVATHAAQLWLSEPAPRALGWPDDVTVSGFAEPFDTFSDMSHLLAAEPAPRKQPEPRGLVYLCSVAPNDRNRTRTREDLALFLFKRAGHLWASAGEADEALREDLVIGMRAATTLQDIADALSTASGPRAPYVRINSAPSDRYNLSLPGTAKLRIQPGNTGYENLYAAGDWTACVLNAGCIEAATISGMLAAEALLEQRLVIIGRGA